MADLAKIVDDLSSLTVLEAAELAKLLEEKWGVSAAAAVAVAAAPARGAAPPLRSKRRPSSRSSSPPPATRRSRSSRKSARSPASASRKPRTWSKARRSPSRKASPRTRPRRSRRPREGRRQGRAQVSSTLARGLGADRQRDGPGQFAPGAVGAVTATGCRPSSGGWLRSERSGEEVRIGGTAGGRADHGPAREVCRRARASRPVDAGARSDMAQHVHRPQARSQVLRQDPRSRGDAEPHRGSEGVLRPVPDGRRAQGRPRRRGPAGGLQVGVPDLRLLQHGAARIRASTSSSRRNTTSTSAASAA